MTDKPGMRPEVLAEGKMFLRHAANAHQLLTDLEKITSIDQATAEAQSRLEVAKREETAFAKAAEKKRAEIDAEIAKRKADADAFVAEKSREAQAHVAYASRKGEEEIRTAQLAAQQIIDEARNSIGEHEAKISKHKTTADVLAEKIKEKEKDLAVIDQAVAERQRVLDEIDAKLTALKARIGV